MTLNITRALGSGVTKALSKAGLAFVVLIGIVQLIFISATNTLTEAFLAGLDLPSESAGASAASPSVPLSLPISATVAGVVIVVALLLLQVLTVVLIRVMVSDRQIITREAYTRRLGWVTLNSIIVAVVIGVLTMIGFVLLIVPGLFLTVSLLFTTIYVADEDESFIAAIQDSWGLASGNRWRLLALYLAVTIGATVVSFALGFVLPSGTAISQVVTIVLSTILVVYIMAVLTDAYRQLRGEAQHGKEPDRDPGVASS